jgi:WD40 repeat protein
VWGDHAVFLWSTTTGELLHTLPWASATDNVYGGLAFSHDGARIAAGLSDSTARVWDAETGELVFAFRMPEQKMPVDSLGFDAAGRRLACGVSGGKIVIWPLRP